jgi:hypothetical protein
VDELYVAARRVLLDALEVLVDHLPSLVLVGAQAVYLQVGEADLQVMVGRGRAFKSRRDHQAGAFMSCVGDGHSPTP